MPNRNAYLKEMGIDVWVERESSIPPAEPEAIINATKTVEPTSVEIKESIDTEIVSKNNVEMLDWDALRSHVTECQLCELSKERKQTVFASGIQTASLMIVGNAPNEQDEQHGNVFSGEAGKLLTAMLKAMGYQRNDIYITNIIKCKTIDNQEPSEGQATTCEAYLLRQISLLKPKLILALGNSAAQNLLKTKSTMNRLRGQLHYVDGINSPVLVSYHPAYLLAAPNEKRKAWDDLQFAMKELNL